MRVTKSFMYETGPEDKRKARIKRDILVMAEASKERNGSYIRMSYAVKIPFDEQDDIRALSICKKRVECRTKVPKHCRVAFVADDFVSKEVLGAMCNSYYKKYLIPNLLSKLSNSDKKIKEKS